MAISRSPIDMNRTDCSFRGKKVPCVRAMVCFMYTDTEPSTIGRYILSWFKRNTGLAWIINWLGWLLLSTFWSQYLSLSLSSIDLLPPGCSTFLEIMTGYDFVVLQMIKISACVLRFFNLNNAWTWRVSALWCEKMKGQVHWFLSFAHQKNHFSH